jgi:Rieske Fe-S protein
MLVADLALGRENPWEKIYSPARKQWHAPGTFIKENVNAAAQLADYVKPGEVGSPEEIEPGHGAVLRDGLARLAVYRDPGGQLHVCSAVCPHLKCVVRWNDTEKSWDCPCHGSRFDAMGKVIIGPAVDDLKAPAPHEA